MQLVNNDDMIKVNMKYSQTVYNRPNGTPTQQQARKGYQYFLQCLHVDGNFRVWGYLKSGAGWIIVSGNAEVI